MPKIAIFDYGAGNLFNLQQSLLRNGAHADIVDTLMMGSYCLESAISTMRLSP